MRYHQEVYEQVAKELGYPYEVVAAAYDSFWRFIRTTIEEMPLKELDETADISIYRPSFNIPSIGKLCCRQDTFTRIKELYKISKSLYGRDSSKEDGISDLQQDNHNSK